MVRSLILIFSFCLAAFGQSASPVPAFLAADVHPSPHATTPTMRGGLLSGGRYEIHNFTMTDLIRAAYDVTADKVQGGPSWLDWNRYDITAKAPAETTAETVGPLLRQLLADRFKLVIHNDTKPISAFTLTAGKKPLLKETQGGTSGCTLAPISQNTPVVFNYSCRNMTMEAFAAAISKWPLSNQYLNNLSVADRTGLKGAWDFDVKYTPRMGDDSVSMIDAVDKQLGLKLESGKVDLPVITVVSASEKPTPNVSNIAELLPPPPPDTFEVATLKPTDPDFKGNVVQIQHGTVNVRGIPLISIFAQAVNLDQRVEVQGLPDWVSTDRYDLVAKAPPGGLVMSIAQDGPATTTPPDIEILFNMIRNLLIERFQIKYHYEDRPAQAYNLLAAKPKMKKADPSNRTSCKEGPGADGKDPRQANPVLSRLVTCQNITMAQFADQMQSMAGGYVRSTVLDQTGLDGAWDFTLSFSPAGAVQGGGGRGGDGPNARSGDAPVSSGASDPNGAISLPDAMEKQLGIRLQEVKRPVRTLVIDHIERKPLDN